MLDKLKVTVHPSVDPTTGEVFAPMSDAVLLEAMREAGWGDDPGVGKAVLTADGREILSPMPVAPPIGYVQEPSVMDRLHQMLDARMRMLSEADVIDSADDMNDFDVPDPEDFQLSSVYEVEMLHEVPALPAAGPQDGSRTDPSRSEARPADGGAKPDGVPLGSV